MTRLTTVAWRSLRHRATSFTATFLAIALSSALIGSFAIQLETAASGDVSDVDAENLVIMGGVIGGWGALIALFALVSTLGVAVRRRSREIGLLRTLGATPVQVRRLVRTETVLVALAAALVGATLAWPGGRLLLSAFQDAGMVSASVEPAAGLLALAGTVLALLLVCLLAATLAGRRATTAPVRLTLDEAPEPGRPPRWRVLVGVLLVAYAAGAGVVTVTVMTDPDDPYAPMQTSGSASIVAGIGLAAMAPAMLAGASAVLGPLLARTGVSGHLAAFNARRRSRLLAGVLGPVVVLTSASAGILTLVGIDSRTLALPPDMTRADAELISTLNVLVVGMIAAFAAIMVVNAVLAVVGDRAMEFGRLRLVGATLRQVRQGVMWESLLIGLVGAVLGLVGSLATIVPFAVARDEGVVPNGQLWVLPITAAGAVLLTVVASQVACHRALRIGTPTTVVATA